MSLIEAKLEASTLDEEAELAAQASIKIVKKYVAENGDMDHEPLGDDDDDDDDEDDDMLDDDMEDHENLKEDHENKTEILERPGGDDGKLRRRLPMSIKELIDYHSSNGKPIKEIVNRINMVCRADEKVSYGVSNNLPFLSEIEIQPLYFHIPFDSS